MRHDIRQPERGVWTHPPNRAGEVPVGITYGGGRNQGTVNITPADAVALALELIRHAVRAEESAERALAERGASR